MPANHIWRENHIEIVYSGELYRIESEEMYNRLSCDPGFDDVQFIIVDCRKLQTVHYSEEDYKIHAALSKAVSEWQQLYKPLRVGVVVSTQDGENSVKKLMSYAQLFHQLWDRRIFYNYNEAIQWASKG